MRHSDQGPVWLHGSYFGENFGDLLLVDLLKRRLESRGRQVGLPFASPVALSRLDAERGLLRLPSRVVFCGGGYFGEPSRGGQAWSRRFRLRHGPALWASGGLANLPPVAIGIGYGPITDPALARRVVAALNRCDTCYFRDEESLDLFRKAGGREREGVRVTTDGAIGLQGNPVPEPVHYPALRADGRRIALLHVVDEYADPAVAAGLVTAAADLASRHRRDWHFIVITDGRGRGGETAQDRTAKILAAQAGIELRPYAGHWDTVSQIAHADFILTSKLHVGIVGAAYGRNVCSVPYHSKTPRFYKHIQQPERCLQQPLTRARIADHLERWLTANEPVALPERVLAASRLNEAALGPLHAGGAA